MVANIFASSIDDFVAIADRLEQEAGVHAIELNVSCPNVAHGGIEFGKDPKLCAAVTRAVRATTRLPLWVKMSPEAPDLVAVARACEEAGADALTAINRPLKFSNSFWRGDLVCQLAASPTANAAMTAAGIVTNSS